MAKEALRGLWYLMPHQGKMPYKHQPGSGQRYSFEKLTHSKFKQALKVLVKQAREQDEEMFCFPKFVAQVCMSPYLQRPGLTKQQVGGAGGKAAVGRRDGPVVSPDRSPDGWNCVCTKFPLGSHGPGDLCWQKAPDFSLWCQHCS